jgi:hypothetical protein
MVSNFSINAEAATQRRKNKMMDKGRSVTNSIKPFQSPSYPVCICKLLSDILSNHMEHQLNVKYKYKTYSKRYMK